MGEQLKIINENGVFRPLEPVDVREHQYMTIRLPETFTVPSVDEF